MTRLPNRQLLQRRVDAHLDSAVDPVPAVALVLIRPDHFGQVAPTLGHPAREARRHAAPDLLAQPALLGFAGRHRELRHQVTGGEHRLVVADEPDELRQVLQLLDSIELLGLGGERLRLVGGRGRLRLGQQGRDLLQDPPVDTVTRRPWHRSLARRRPPHWQAGHSTPHRMVASSRPQIPGGTTMSVRTTLAATAAAAVLLAGAAVAIAATSSDGSAAIADTAAAIPFGGPSPEATPGGAPPPAGDASQGTRTVQAGPAGVVEYVFDGDLRVAITGGGGPDATSSVDILPRAGEGGRILGQDEGPANVWASICEGSVRPDGPARHDPGLAAATGGPAGPAPGLGALLAWLAALLGMLA